MPIKKPRCFNIIFSWLSNSKFSSWRKITILFSELHTDAGAWNIKNRSDYLAPQATYSIWKRGQIINMSSTAWLFSTLSLCSSLLWWYPWTLRACSTLSSAGKHWSHTLHCRWLWCGILFAWFLASKILRCCHFIFFSVFFFNQILVVELFIY